MKTITKILAVFVFLNISLTSSAQIDALGQFMAAGVEDGEKLLEGYMAPYLYAFGASLTGGWYNTAKPHQLGGFDITATINTAIVPSSDKTFDLSTLGLSNLALADDNDNISPTVAGKNENGPDLVYDYTVEGIEISGNAFTMPEGIDWAYIPSPMIQGGVGLIKDTEIMGRFMPKVSVGKNNDIFMWGVGMKHGISQWVPFLKKIPVLHVSVMGGYTKLKSNLGLAVDPGSINASNYQVVDTDFNIVTDPNWDDQNLNLMASSFTGNLLISANLPVVCFYGGIGFATTKTNLKMEGNYPILYSNGIERVVIQKPNPIDMEVKNQDGGTTKPRFNIGMRLKFGVFTLHGDYTYANYSMATGGIGISFR